MRSWLLYCIILSNYKTIAATLLFFSYPTIMRSRPLCYFFQVPDDRGHVLFIFIPTTTQSRPQCHFLSISTYHTIEGTVLFLLFPPSITIQSRSRSYFFPFPTTIRSWPQCYFFCFSVQLPCDHIHGISLF